MVVEVQDLVGLAVGVPDDVEGLPGRPGVGLEADGVDGCRPRDEIHCHGNELVPGDEGVQVGPGLGRVAAVEVHEAQVTQGAFILNLCCNNCTDIFGVCIGKKHQLQSWIISDLLSAAILTISFHFSRCFGGPGLVP